MKKPNFLPEMARVDDSTATDRELDKQDNIKLIVELHEFRYQKNVKSVKSRVLVTRIILLCSFLLMALGFAINGFCEVVLVVKYNNPNCSQHKWYESLSIIIYDIAIVVLASFASHTIAMNQSRRRVKWIFGLEITQFLLQSLSFLSASLWYHYPWFFPKSVQLVQGVRSNDTEDSSMTALPDVESLDRWGLDPLEVPSQMTEEIKKVNKVPWHDYFCFDDHTYTTPLDFGILVLVICCLHLLLVLVLAYNLHLSKRLLQLKAEKGAFMNRLESNLDTKTDPEGFDSLPSSESSETEEKSSSGSSVITPPLLSSKKEL